MFTDESISDTLNLFSKINNFTNKTIKIPSFVMLGSQSSGKSIILSRLINYPLPSGTGMVTKRPTIIYLIKSDKLEISISSDSIEEEKENENKESANGEKVFYDFISSHEYLKQRMSILTEKELVIKFSGPKLFPIKLIDLPGLIQFNNDNQESCRIIEKINLKYLNDPLNLILNVINGNVDFHTIESLSVNRKVDPNFLRSFFVVTKLDLIPGKFNTNFNFESPELLNIMKLLRNEDLRTKHGFCGVINFINESNNFQEMNKEERDFINKSSFKKIKEIGIDFLINKLKNIYAHKLKENFLGIEKNLKALLKENKKEYKKILKTLDYENKMYNTILIKFHNDFKNILYILLGKDKETKTFNLNRNISLKDDLNRLFSIKNIRKLSTPKDCTIFSFKEVFEKEVLEDLKEQETHLIQQFILLKYVVNGLITDIFCEEVDTLLLQELKRFILHILKKRLKKIKKFIKRIIQIETRFINCELPEFNSKFLTEIKNTFITKEIKGEIFEEKEINSIFSSFCINPLDNPQKSKTYETYSLEVYYKFYCERISNNLMDSFKKIVYFELFIYFEEKMPLKYIKFMQKYFKNLTYQKNQSINKTKTEKYLKNIKTISDLLKHIKEI